MKIYGLLLFFISSTIVCMELALKEAIINGDEHKLKTLLREVPNSSTSLLEHSVNYDELHQLAAELAQQKEHNSHTLNNRHVYQRGFAAVISLLGGGYAVVDYFMSGNFDQQKLAQIAGGLIALYHGGNNLYLGWTNRDANNESARHHAITAHLKAAHQTVQAPAPYGNL